ncbi:COMM domain-containing protein 10-like [Dysidea avara]|uniref:COMM domain-containing protein 10-like n=1 Tax=Dysidea avara TaxID=196820 RepID=UPI00331E4B08
MAELFQATASVKRAVMLINDMDPGKFPRLLSRVLQKLHLKDERAFSTEEEQKLQAALELEAKDLELVLDTIAFILEQAAYHLAKPSLLGQQLKEAGLNEDKVTIFVQGWTGYGKGVVEKLQNRTFYPKQLEKVNWQMGLQMAQAASTKMKVPNALFELVVHDKEQTDSILLDFTHEELYKFYQQLEVVQTQLDSLS